MAYKNSIEIQGQMAVRQAMYDIVSKDDRTGGRYENNNREHGGYIDNGVVFAVPSGPVTNPAKDETAFISLPMDYDTFHSHCSGTIVELPALGSFTQTSASFFKQPPSDVDINNAGNTTRYVFGMGNGKVYIYNSKGVQATVDMNYFVKPLKLY
jgi:hypothetical protein